MVGKRYFSGTPLLEGTYVARTDNDNGEDCKRQCEENTRCNAWEFGSWQNKFHCANWEKTESGYWANEVNRLAAGEGNTPIVPPEEPETATTEGAYTCGTTMEECEAAFVAATTPAITNMVPTMVLDGCDEPDDAAFAANVVSTLAGWDESSMRLCVNNGQYAVEVEGKVYPTCVAYGAAGEACTDDSLICPDRNVAPGIFGWAGNARAALTLSMTRADFGHPQCPTATCRAMDDIAESNRYWKDMVLGQNSAVTEADVDAICVEEDGSTYVITREGKCNTCIGWSRDATATCDSKEFLCAGHSGDGEFTYGWPGQIARTLAVAALNAEGNYMHPQCPLMICEA